MALPANHHELVAEAKRRTDEYNANLEKQMRVDDGFRFAKIGSYVPSEAEKEQLRRLAAIQGTANAAVFEGNVQF